MEKTSVSKKRLPWIDVLNIFACVSVVFLHSTNAQVHAFNGSYDIPYYIGMFSHSFFLWAVPIFLMISGYNLLGYKGNWLLFFKKRFFRTVVPFILWSFFYFALFFHRSIPVREFIERFCNGQFNNHMWFFIPLFALYLSTPFLASFVQNASERKLKFFVVTAFVFVSLIPFIFAMAEINCWKGSMFPLGTKYFIYAVLGYSFSKLDWFDRNRKVIYVVGGVSAVVQLSFMTFLSHEGSILYKNFLQYESPLNFFISLSVFLLFSKTNWSNLFNHLKIDESKVAMISSCSLGVYLIHAAVIFVFKYLNTGIYNPYYGFIVIYLVSLSIVLLMKKVPFIKNMVP